MPPKAAILDSAYIEQQSIPEPNSGCWIWLNATGNKGYGQIKIRGHKRQSAHRASFSIFCSEPSPTNDIDHRCRNVLCVNPQHLEEVTHKINCQRRNAIRSTCPQGHPYSGVDARGARRCRTCDAVASRKYRIKRLDRAGLVGP